MKPIRIDFAPHSFQRTVKRTRPATWLFGCIGLLVCAVAVITAFGLATRHDALRADVRRVEVQLMQRTALKREPKKFALPEAQATAVNSTIAQLNLPWRDVLDAIEAATPGDIALLAIDPDAKKHLLKGMAEAKTSDGMIAYVERLKQQPFFASVVLTKHEINEQDPNRPMRFQFEAQWAGGDQ
jgi:Tfp pilus assembly protein PilN